MKKYIKENKNVLKFINNKKYNIISIKPVIKEFSKGFINHRIITSYCINYEKV